jgi:hypothetical protein
MTQEFSSPSTFPQYAQAARLAAALLVMELPFLHTNLQSNARCRSSSQTKELAGQQYP